MFRNSLNKPPILFSKTQNTFKLTPINQSQISEKKVKIVPKYFQKGTFKREG